MVWDGASSLQPQAVEDTPHWAADASGTNPHAHLVWPMYWAGQGYVRQTLCQQLSMQPAPEGNRRRCQVCCQWAEQRGINHRNLPNWEGMPEWQTHGSAGSRKAAGQQTSRFSRRGGVRGRRIWGEQSWTRR